MIIPFRTDKRHRFTLWALLLVSLVILTCLEKTLAEASQWIPGNHTSTLSRQAAPEADWQSLYQNTFKTRLEDNAAKSLSKSSGDPCHSSSETLPPIPSKANGIAPFIVLFWLLYCCIRFIKPVFLRADFIPRQPKQRLHLTHCVFQE